MRIAACRRLRPIEAHIGLGRTKARLETRQIRWVAGWRINNDSEDDVASRSMRDFGPIKPPPLQDNSIAGAKSSQSFPDCTVQGPCREMFRASH
jgi:hypothetical protein